jgi:hypothetical protein
MAETFAGSSRLRAEPSLPGAVYRKGGLRNRPRSADRTRSPAVVSQKREFLKYLLETIGYFALRMPKIGGWRPVANLRKPAICGPLCEYQGRFP